MTSTLRFRLVAVLLILMFANTSVFAQLFPNLHNRMAERRAAATTPTSANAMLQLQRLADEIKANPRMISANDKARAQRLLLDAVNDLQRRLPREFDRETANDWATTFQLAELRATLATQTPDAEILEAVRGAFYSDKEGVRWIVFDGLRTALRRYQTIDRMLADEGSYERQLVSICERLVEVIEQYNEGRIPGSFLILSDATAWLDDISIIEPRAARLAELTRIAFSGVNVRLRVGADFVAAGFSQEIVELLDIDEMILRTHVVGGGTLRGRSSAELVNSPNRATIRVLADARLETNTEGSQRMVTLNNHTTGTLQGEKQIIFSAEGITTTPARARANLNAQLSNVRIDAGPIVRLIARTQIEPRSEDVLEEASRRAERQMSEQLNERIDANIAELDGRYQRIRGLLNRTGLFPRMWNLSSTTERIDWAISLGDRYQPTAPVAAPALPATNGLAVQVHQSALNNILTIALAGRFIDEDRFAQRIGEFFDETPEFLQRRADETPAQVSFMARRPIDVLFVDDKIRVVVRLDNIQVMDNASRSFVITVEYQIRMEERNGQPVVVFEQTEAQAYPIGFVPGGGATLSTAQTIIRTYLMRRLGELPERHEAVPLALGGEWAGPGRLIPQFASAENGWLTLVWDWRSVEL